MPHISAARLSLYRRWFERLVEDFGGPEEISRRLNVPTTTLQRWLEGNEAIPYSLVLRAADLVLDRKLGRSINEAGSH